MQSEDIKKLIEAGLPGAEVCVEGDGTHFTTLVICTEFVGKSRIQRQQMVNETVLKQLLDGRLHALSIKTLTPDEWDKIDHDEAH
jgi:acid stress-induced BolA-like protein IbaG/YrbA